MVKVASFTCNYKVPTPKSLVDVYCRRLTISTQKESILQSTHMSFLECSRPLGIP